MTDDDASGETTQPIALAQIARADAKRRKREMVAEVIVKKKIGDVRVTLLKEETVIGRDSGCDIVLAESAVSSRHARIRRNEAGLFLIEDMGSTNGIVVQKRPLSRMVLMDGDVFTIGETECTFVTGTK
jgi:pSer/pThr/pTyr-binding forkhead associated (FHA) protein